MLAKTLEELQAELGESVRIVKVDTDEEQDLSSQLQARELTAKPRAEALTQSTFDAAARFRACPRWSLSRRRATSRPWCATLAPLHTRAS